ncbi:MAG: hypothetical protein ACOC0Y_02060 [Spirochaetota bacterium]
MRNPNPWIAASFPLSLGAIALLMCTTVSFAAHPMGAFYSDEVYTSRSVGGGYEADDSVYFLVEYGLYQKPQGIARLPDGVTLMVLLKSGRGGRVRINETTTLLERATLRSLGLPSPLDHMSRSDQQFQRDLVELRGDEYYRRAIIEAMASGDIRAEPEGSE